MRGRVGKPPDYSAAKRHRMAEREAVERRRRAALAELELVDIDLEIVAATGAYDGPRAEADG